MRVLLIGRDAAGLDQSSATFDRWRLLRDAGIELVCVIASRKAGRAVEPGIEAISGGGGNLLVRLWNVWRMAGARAGSVDLVSAQDPFELGLIAYRTARRAQKPFELQDHGGFFDGRDSVEPWWPVRKRLAYWLAKKADAVRTVSPGSLTNLKTLGLGGKAYFLPIAVRCVFSGLAIRKKPGSLVTVSRLVPLKRVDLLLRAFASLKRRHPGASLTIVGDGPERARLESLADGLGLHDDVVFVGSADPAEWLAEAEVFVMLSKHEGWGLAAVEAAMAGVPVVMTDTGCSRWLEGLGRAVVIPVDCTEERVADALEKAQAMPPADCRMLADAQPKPEQQAEQWKKIANTT